MAIEKIPAHPWAVQNNPTVYDEEALTVLELVGRSEGKVNECVEAFNELDANTGKTLASQDKRISDHVTQIADMWARQLENLPMQIKLGVWSLGDEGFFSRIINEYAGNLQAQVSALQSGISEGGTTMDAEIIAARVGPYNTVYSNVGENIRETGKYIDENLHFIREGIARVFAEDSANPYILTRVPLVEGRWTTNGIVTDVAATVSCPTLFASSEMGEYIFDDTKVKLTFHKFENGSYIQGGDFRTKSPVTATSSSWVGPTIQHGITLRSVDGSNLEPFNTELYRKIPLTNGLLSTVLKGEKPAVDSANYTTSLPDLNALSGPAVKKLLFGKGDTSIPANLPFTEWPGGVALLMAGVPQKNGGYQTQVLFAVNGVFFRYSGTPGDFGPWVNLSRIASADSANALYVTAGESILAGVKKAYAEGYPKVIVEAGEYNLLAEYEALYGANYFPNYKGYSTGDPFARGLWLENIELVFAPGAVVKANYAGSNQSVKDYFAPIACGNNVVIDGLHLEATNMRYGIHPDFNTGAERSTLVIKNCDLSHVKGTVCKAIGAGFGIHTDIIVENTIFRSHTSECVFSIHNNAASNACSRMTVRNCYVVGPGYFQFNSYGGSTAETPVIVSGCSYATEPVNGKESGASANNVKMYKFANEKRYS